MLSKVNHNLVTVVLVVAALLGAAIAINEFKRGQYIGVDISRLQTMSFSGEGKAAVVPDIAEVSLTVFSQSSDVKRAQDDNARKMNAIIAFLDEQGVAKKDLVTSQYTIYPQYDYTQSGQRFRGYEVRQTVSVKIRDFAKISSILSEAVAKGANEVGNLSFTVENKDEVLAQARSEAITKAKTKAETLARDLGIKLGKIIGFSEGSSPIYEPRYYKDMAIGMGGAESAPAPAIEVGENEFVSNVTLTYQIEY